MIDQDGDSVIPTLSKDHYATMVALIDAMCERGAIRGGELVTVGQLRADISLVVERMEQVEIEDE